MVKVDGIYLNITEDLKNTLRENPTQHVMKPVMSKKKDKRNEFVVMQEVDEDGNGVFAKATIDTHPFVYFDKNGNFYFNVFRSKIVEHEGKDVEVLVTNNNLKTDENCKLYGRGIVSHYAVIPGSDLWADGRDTNMLHREVISKGDPNTLIVKKMTRQQVLDIDIKPQGDSLIAKISNSSDAEKAAIAEQIFGKSVMDKISKILSQTEEE